MFGIFIYFSIFVGLFLLCLSLSISRFQVYFIDRFIMVNGCGCVSMLMLYFYGKKQCNKKKCGHLSVFSLLFSRFASLLRSSSILCVSVKYPLCGTVYLIVGTWHIGWQQVYPMLKIYMCIWVYSIRIYWVCVCVFLSACMCIVVSNFYDLSKSSWFQPYIFIHPLLLLHLLDDCY